jgi:hypothetical protein
VATKEAAIQAIQYLPEDATLRDMVSALGEADEGMTSFVIS